MKNREIYGKNNMWSSRIKRANDLMLILGLNEIIDQFTTETMYIGIVTCQGGRM